MAGKGVVVFLLTTTLLVRLYFHFSPAKEFSQGDKLRISDSLTSEPLKFTDKQYFKTQGLKVYVPLYPEISYGDRVTVEGAVEGDTLKNARLIKLTTSNNGLYSIRETLIGFYQESLPMPHAGLVAGMVLGSKTGIDSALWESLKTSGTAHVVVASGMNITFVATFLLSFLVIFGRRKFAIVGVLIGIWCYALFSGFDAPVVRAAIMATVTFTAQAFGRLSTALWALLLSGYFMLLLSPSWLGDLGFWLSFFATLSLIVLESRFRSYIFSSFKKLPWVRPKVVRPFIEGFLRDIATSLAAQVGVAPILYYYFGQLNILSPLINALVLWTVAPIMVIGMLAGVVGLVFEPLGRLLLYLVYPLTYYFVSVVEFFG